MAISPETRRRWGFSGLRLKPSPKYQKASSRKKHQWWGLGFVLPILVLFIVFKFWPISRALWLSFTDANPLADSFNYVGLENYRELATDSLFIKSLRVTGYYVVGTVVPLVALSLGLALLMDQAIRGRSVFRSLIFLPAIVPVVVVPILWRFLFHPFGLVNEVVTTFGFDAINWLQTTEAVIPAFIIASEWRFAPLFMIVFLAGLQSIPQELIDAARVDGASPVQRFRTITLPLLKPTTLVVIVVSMTMTARSLVLSLVLTGGGPDGASRLLSLFIFEQGFRNFRIGYASAATMVLLAIMMTLTIVNLRLGRTDD